MTDPSASEKSSAHKNAPSRQQAAGGSNTSDAARRVAAGGGTPGSSSSVRHHQPQPHHRPESPVRVVIWSGSGFGNTASGSTSSVMNPGFQSGTASGNFGPGGHRLMRGERSGEAIVRTADVVTEIIHWFKGLLITFAALAAIPLAGLVGFRHGFAEVLGVPELEREVGASLSDGVRLVLFAPRRVFDAGMIDTPTLILAFVVLILGVGALALTVVRMASTRASEAMADDVAAGGFPSSLASSENPFIPIVRAIGDVIVMLVSVIQVGWALGRYREMFGTGMIPLDGPSFAKWLDVARATAGIDLILFAAAIIWLIVAVRLRTPKWLRVLTIVFAAFMVMSLWAQAAMSNSVISQVDQIRSVFVTPATASPSTGSAGTTTPAIDTSVLPPGSKNLIVGHTASHLVVINDKAAGLRFVPTTIEFEVNARMTMPEFIEKQNEKGAASSPSN